MGRVIWACLFEFFAEKQVLHDGKLSEAYSMLPYVSKIEEFLLVCCACVLLLRIYAFLSHSSPAGMQCAPGF